MKRKKSNDGRTLYAFEDVIAASKTEYVFRDCRNGRYIQSHKGIKMVYDIEDGETKYISIRYNGGSKHWIPKEDYES